MRPNRQFANRVGGWEKGVDEDGHEGLGARPRRSYATQRVSYSLGRGARYFLGINRYRLGLCKGISVIGIVLTSLRSTMIVEEFFLFDGHGIDFLVDLILCTR